MRLREPGVGDLMAEFVVFGDPVEVRSEREHLEDAHKDGSADREVTGLEPTDGRARGEDAPGQFRLAHPAAEARRLEASAERLGLAGGVRIERALRSAHAHSIDETSASCQYYVPSRRERWRCCPSNGTRRRRITITNVVTIVGILPWARGS